MDGNMVSATRKERVTREKQRELLDKLTVKFKKEEVKTVGIKSGCFTILTAGHIETFREASSHCDYLIVLNNDDAYIKNKKGVVPIPLDERLDILRSIRYVDEAHSFSSSNEEEWVRAFKNSRLVDEFPKCERLVLFHSPEAMVDIPIENVVGFGVADKLKMIQWKPFSSVSDIFKRIRSDDAE
jgi:cytidyltransferase-like protein